MEMSIKYLNETADALEGLGFGVERILEPDAPSGKGVFARHRFVLSRPDEKLVMEGLVYPDGTVRYYLEFVDFHGIHSFSFPLDSWKHRPERIEFKYYERLDTGEGLSLTLKLPRGD